jgi:tellurite resistance-related uncharacterized protein
MMVDQLPNNQILVTTDADQPVVLPQVVHRVYHFTVMVL